MQRKIERNSPKAVQGPPGKLLKTVMLSSALLGPAVSACLTAAPLLAEPAADRLRLKVPVALKVEGGLQAALSVEIMPRNAVPRQAMVLIRGLPPSATLSAGRLFGSGVWALKPADLGGLRIVTAPQANEHSEIDITLMTLEGRTLGKAVSRLTIVARAPPATVATAAEPTGSGRADRLLPPEAQRPPMRIYSGRELEDILILMQKGDENMRDGKVNAARLFYTHAADQGWAEGALAVAATYDEIELSRLKIIGGVEANPDLAREWYEKAKLMGAKDAGERLQRMSQR